MEASERTVVRTMGDMWWLELRRANEILKSASAFFAAELDRRPTR